MLVIFEIIAVLLIALGFIWEHKVVAFEDRLFAMLKKAVTKSRAKRRAAQPEIYTKGARDSSIKFRAAEFYDVTA